MRTLAEVTEATGFEVLEHLEAEAEVPVLDGLQAQGDLLFVPVAAPGPGRGDGRRIIPPAGVAVIEAGPGGGHEHRLFAGTPGTASWQPGRGGGQSIGVLECTEPVFSLHVEHGAAGLAPGAWELRRQREQADVERLVAD